VAVTLAMIPKKTPRGIVIASARLGTNDLQETIDWWKAENVPVWGVIPERVGIAAGPEARLYRDGLDEYGRVLKRILRTR
jgi:chromosome partitioning protein